MDRKTLLILMALGILLALAPATDAAPVDPDSELDETSDWVNCFIDANVDYREWCGPPPDP